MASDSGIAMMNDVHAVSEKDQACLMEIAEVLQRHGKLNRFGVTLLHRHFDIAPDEILVEDCDHETRTLTSRPVKQSALAKFDAAETSWYFYVETPGEKPKPKIRMGCVEKCVKQKDGSHGSVHFVVQ